ncbi:MAG: PilZ domain-containing protein [SAR324 cluster bacterium]|nr:PilZ domain-containing protein [SAR324 cluster bacterium]
MTNSASIGLELLAPEDTVIISRFAPRIRWLHWFNATMILLLYTLGISQIVELRHVGDFLARDTRWWHITIGIFWMTGSGILSLIVLQNPTGKGGESIVSDKMIVKQWLFLLLSVVVITLMSITGITLYFLRPHDLPGLKSVLIALHGLFAVLYLPLLGYHIYLGTINTDTRYSLSTMLVDVHLQGVIHNFISGLTCRLSDEESILFVDGTVEHVSILSFEARIKTGSWEKWVDLKQMTIVDFVHPSLSGPVRLPVRLDTRLHMGDHLLVNFNYAISHQESARLLLSHAIFFRKLFLEQRFAPRHSCNIPVSGHTLNDNFEGILVDMSVGGVGLLTHFKIKPKTWAWVNIESEALSSPLTLGGRIMTRKKQNKQWVYGLKFMDLSTKEHDLLDRLLLYVKYKGLGTVARKDRSRKKKLKNFKFYE